MGDAGFALDEYVAPRHGAQSSAPQHTMPKASLEVGGMLADVKNRAKVPGPEMYNKGFLEKSFNAKAAGGTFAKGSKEYQKAATKTPSVGHYETVSVQCTPKVKGGSMGKNDRGCYFLDVGMKHSKNVPAPGKYDAVVPGAKPKAPIFAQSKTESRNPAKPSQIGPGHYQIDHSLVEKRQPIYSSPREATKSFLDKAIKGKEKLPAPGHNGTLESKVEDRAGRRVHMAKLLGDHVVSPRMPMSAR
eukprot:TRINITY_DN32525_c0_g1_i1.p1 TRINITY_DN32525_c0_g1~~TRINITY_DN32525_c0_g1_i1.p1  ORF type:complete len:286 (+),score=43.27 TRINITY_DN32525_c0_g1_i1:124-858(+)